MHWSNQSILKEITPEYSLEGLMLKHQYWNALATWHKGPTHWKRPWCWGGLSAREGGDRGWDGWMAELTHWHEFESTPGDGERQGSLACCSPWCHKDSDDLVTKHHQWTLGNDCRPPQAPTSSSPLHSCMQDGLSQLQQIYKASCSSWYTVVDLVSALFSILAR